MKISVIIPVFNESDSIGRVLGDIPKEHVSEIIVVNNNSTDNTAGVALNHGAVVIDESRPGYGNSCIKGIEYLASGGEHNNPDIVVFMDGDYSDFPEELVKVVGPIVDEGYDLVIGSRTLGKRESGSLLPQALIGNYIATKLISLFYGYRFTDLGPFRAIRFHKLIELNMQDRNYGWTVEMQVKAAKKKFRCTEVPVSYRKRIGVSKVTGTLEGTIKAGYKIIWTIFKNIW